MPHKRSLQEEWDAAKLLRRKPGADGSTPARAPGPVQEDSRESKESKVATGKATVSVQAARSGERALENS